MVTQVRVDPEREKGLTFRNFWPTKALLDNDVAACKIANLFSSSSVLKSEGRGADLLDRE